MLEGFDGRRLLAHEIDHERHGEVVQAVTPRDFHDDVQADEVVASIEHTHVAFAAANIDELRGRSVNLHLHIMNETYVSQQLFNHIKLA